jgi:exodeoxyribonuclease V alpha subunit
VSAVGVDLDLFDARLARGASGLLREFNQAGVLSAADLHVARRLGTLGGEDDETVLLAVALAVRGPRLGHVHVDLQRIRGTVAVEAENPVDLEALPWPSPADWVARVAASPLVAAPDEPMVRPLRLLDGWLYLDRYWTEEVAVADALRAMLADEPAGIDAAVLADGLARLFGGEADGRQALAAAASVRRRFAVVAGGPGTGKTTTVARIVALLCEQAERARHADGRPGLPPLIALAAPTGKAAARLQEAVQAEALTLDVSDEIRAQLLGMSASTIHRLLGWRPGSNSRFRHSREQRLPHDAVIVDETSMVSLSLMARLIEALRSDARLVLVGDPGQLASIEAGAVLGDIVGSVDSDATSPDESVGAAGSSSGGDPGARGIVVLDREHRFGGGIARLAGAIRRGDVDATLAVLREGAADVTWTETEREGAGAVGLVRSSAVAGARAMIAAAREGSATDALTALATFRILCAHRRGPYGVTTWTTRMEDWLANEIPGFSAQERFYVGRPLLVTENDYELGLHNGDTGVVVRTGEDRVLAVFERGGESVAFSPSRLGAVETVYAMTIHKSQGSQFDAAAVILPEPDSRILTRELLYTAATRARRRLILAGSEEAVVAAVDRPVARASGLGWRLAQGEPH